MNPSPRLVFTLCPARLPLWLSEKVALRLGVSRGAQLSREQWASDAVQELLAARRPKSIHAVEKGEW